MAAFLKKSAALCLALVGAASCERDARKDAVSVSADGAATPAWRERLQGLMLSTPEWSARATEVARGKAPLDADRPVLGLACSDDREPAGCKLEDPKCRLGCDAIRLCSGCGGGRWLTLELRTAKGTLYIQDEELGSPTYMTLLPYGQWRNQFRAQARKQGNASYRALADPRQAFPDLHVDQGELGYGKPAPGSSPPPAEVRAVLAKGGFVLGRVEHYGPTEFPVFIVTGKSSRAGRQFRAWGAELVDAAGGRACELVVSATERYQFDRFAAEADAGGVYSWIDGNFHPWLPSHEE